MAGIFLKRYRYMLAVMVGVIAGTKDVIPFGPSIYAGTVVGIFLTGL